MTIISWSLFLRRVSRVRPPTGIDWRMGTGRIRDGVECGQSTIAREVVTIITTTLTLTTEEEQILMPHRRTGDISQERTPTPGTTIHTITTTTNSNNNNCTEGRPGRRVTGTEIPMVMVIMDKEEIGHLITNRGHRITVVEQEDLVGITTTIMEDLPVVRADRRETVEEGMLMETRNREEEEDTTDRCIITMIKGAVVVVMVQEDADMIIIPTIII